MSLKSSGAAIEASPDATPSAILLEEWMEHIEAQGRAATTMARYRSAIGANIKPRLGSLAINKVGAAELDRLYGQLAKAGLGPLSIRKSHAILSAAFNQAVKWGWVDVNPVLRASSPIGPRWRDSPSHARGAAAALEACASSHEDLGSLIFVAATTGARRGELCGLRRTDLDLDLATMTVSRSIYDAGREVTVKDTKTHQARRIALDAATVSVLRSHRSRVVERATEAGIAAGGR